MTTPARPRFKWPMPGTCRVCGCTDARACPGGCSWADDLDTVCSTCGGTDADMAYVLSWIPRIFRRPMVYATRRALMLQAVTEASKRYGARLVAQEHG